MKKLKPPPSARKRDGKIDWQKQQQFDLEFARQAVIKTGGVSPMAVLHLPTGQRLAIMIDWSDKPTMRQFLRLFCVAYDAVGLTIITEAWSTTVKEDRKRGESMDDYMERLPLPSQSERRIEVVIVQTCFYDDAGEKQELFTQCEIVRGVDGKPTGLGPELYAGDSIAGPTFEILPEERAPLAAREEALKLLQSMRPQGSA